MDSTTDLFFSYRRLDLDRAKPFLDALTAEGLSVWRDESEIEEYAPITQAIRSAIGSSRALLAFYSNSYPQSHACFEELTTAWIATENSGEPPLSRVLVINPEARFDHLPEVLRDQQLFQLGSAHQDGWREAAVRIRELVQRLNGALQKNAIALPRYFGMSAISAQRFEGRVAEMWNLHGQLTSNRMSIITGVFGQAAAQVRGMGGNGKSMLAREYAIRFGPAYPGGVFWINAYGNDDSKGALDAGSRDALRRSQVHDFAERLGLGAEGMSHEQIEAIFWRTLEQAKSPCLWIIDDLPSNVEVGELQGDWLPRWSGASTLITTRSGEYRALGTSGIDLQMLARDEAFRLLTRRNPPADQPEVTAAQRIVAELGGHPLATEVAGAYLARFSSYENYRAALGEADTDAVELGAQLRELLPTGHERSIVKTLLSSMRSLSGNGRAFLQLASVLAVAPIPLSLVEEAFRIWPAAERPNAILALDEVDTFGLAQLEGTQARSVHTLVSRVVSRYGIGRAALPRDVVQLVALLALSNRISERTRDVREHPEIALEIAHARHLLSGNLDNPLAANLGRAVAEYDFVRGDYTTARELQRRLVEAGVQDLGPDHRHTLATKHNLAVTLRAQGELGAARAIQEANLNRMGPGDPHRSAALAALASTMREQGDLTGARQLQEEVVRGLESELGALDENTLAAKSNLAVTLEKLGDHDGARALQEPILEARIRECGPDHPDTMTIAANLALNLKELGQLDRARNLQEEVMSARIRLLGPEHPQTLMLMDNLAVTRYQQKDFEGARELQERALEASRRTLGEEHPDTLITMGNLADTMKALGDVEGAQRLVEQVLVAQRKFHGPEHPLTLSAMIEAAEYSSSNGDLPRARVLLETVVAARGKIYGSDHRYTIAAAQALVFVLQGSGALDEARALAARLVESARRTFGEEHKDTLLATWSLAVTMQEQGEYHGSVSLLRGVLEKQARLIGPDDDQTVRTRQSLAHALMEMHRWDEAKELLGQVLEARGQSAPAGDSSTNRELGSLGVILRSQGDTKSARRLHVQVAEAFERTLGPDHPETLDALNDLGETLHRDGDLVGARHIQERALEAARRTLGEDHHTTRAAMINLGGTLYAQGDLKGARKLEERALESSRKAYGTTHPATTQVAWNLYRTVVDSRDQLRARYLYSVYFLPLARRPADSLSPHQLSTLRLLKLVPKGR